MMMFLPEVILFANVRVRAITIQNNKHSSHNTICLLHNIRLSTGLCIDARTYSHGALNRVVCVHSTYSFSHCHVVLHPYGGPNDIPPLVIV